MALVVSAGGVEPCGADAQEAAAVEEHAKGDEEGGEERAAEREREPAGGGGADRRRVADVSRDALEWDAVNIQSVLE